MGIKTTTAPQRAGQQMSEMDFVEAMVKIAAEDRDLYRQLRAEAWAIVAANHQLKTPREIAVWLGNAS